MDKRDHYVPSLSPPQESFCPDYSQYYTTPGFLMIPTPYQYHNQATGINHQSPSNQNQPTYFDTQYYGYYGDYSYTNVSNNNNNNGNSECKSDNKNEKSVIVNTNFSYFNEHFDKEKLKDEIKKDFPVSAVSSYVQAADYLNNDYKINSEFWNNSEKSVDANLKRQLCSHFKKEKGNFVICVDLLWIQKVMNKKFLLKFF